MILKRWSKGVLCLAVAVGAFVGVWSMVPHVWHGVYCDLVLPLTTWQPRVERLLECSNVRQARLPAFDLNVEEQDTEYPGWKVFVPRDKSLPGRVRLKVSWERDRMVIFPRLNGPGNDVSVFQVMDVDHTRKPLFVLHGARREWTPVGGQYEVNLGCVREAMDAQVFDIVLEIELFGPWAQVWHKDGQVFFY